MTLAGPHHLLSEVREHDRRRGPSVVVTEEPGAPFDVDRWVAGYVALVLELEGIAMPVASPPAASVR